MPIQAKKINVQQLEDTSILLSRTRYFNLHVIMLKQN